MHKNVMKNKINIMKNLLTYISVVLILIISTAASAEKIDFNKSDFYVKKGFSKEWINNIPAGDNSWLVVPAAKNQTSMRVNDLPFPDKQQRTFFSYKKYKNETYTFITSFQITKDETLKKDFLGLYIDHIAENWEIYLNGNLIKSEMYLDEKGDILEYRNTRRELVFLNSQLLKTGDNVLAFRIVGNPTIEDTGFYSSIPLQIDNYEKLSKDRIRMGQLILLFVYIMTGLYHLMLYFFRKSERYNLVFGIFSVMLFIYLFCRTTAIYLFIPDTKWALLIEFISLYTLFPLIIIFLDFIFFGRIKIFAYGYSAFCLILFAITIASPFSVMIDILRIWQTSVIIPAIYITFFQIGYAFKTKVVLYRNSILPENQRGLLRSIWHSLAKTVPGNLMIGAMVALGCAVFDVLDAMFFTTGIVLTNYGFLIFVIGITVVLSNRFVYLYSEIDGLNLDLKQKAQDLNETRVKFGISQEKYQLLVEGSADIIFSIDEKFNLLTANKAMRDLFHMGRDELLNKNFLELLHEPDGRLVTTQIMQEKLENLLQEKKPIHVKLDFKTAFGIEPVSLHVRFEYINIEGRYEIFGRGTSVSEDVLNQYLEVEKHRYRIGNMLLLADDLSFRITRNLHKFVNKQELGLIRLAFREMIINAIEHGNLAISFEEKTVEMNNGNYLTYLNERQKDPRFSGRTIIVEYHVDLEKIEYSITDEGDGFDYIKYLSRNSEADGEILEHGRGISLAKNIFDEIKYNESGNRVTMLKFLKKNS